MEYLTFCNQGGFPTIKAISAKSDGTNTIVSFNNHPYRQTNKFYGGFFVKIEMAISGSTQPLMFATEGVANSAVPVYLKTGAQATGNTIKSDGPAIYMAFYDRDNNRVQLF